MVAVGGSNGSVGPVEVDWAAVFDAVPTPYLVLDPDLRIVAVNSAREAVTGLPREEVLGHRVFDVFPDDPSDPDADGVRNLGASLRRVLETGRVDVMPVQRYAIRAQDGAFVERWWSPVNAPVLDAAGRVVLVLHRVEDVTEQVRGWTAEALVEHVRDADPVVAAVAADVWVQARQLREALTAEAEVSRRLEALVEVAVRLAGARTVEELTELVIDHGLAAVGADGGAVAVLRPDGGVLHLTMTESLGPEAERAFGRLPASGRLPAAVAAATGEVVLLHDRRASLAWAPEMALAVELTGLVAWAALPLRAGDRVLGSLIIGWREAQAFARRDVDLMAAFAAQCAQILARLQAAAREREAAAAQQDLTEALQRRLLSAPLEEDHLEVAARYLPATAEHLIGGDWYDSFLAPDGELTLVIGDVTGHDRDAAADMAQLRNLLRGVCATLGEPPAAVLTGLDRATHLLGAGIIATAVLAQVVQAPAGAGARVLRWSSAGHPPPVLVLPDGSARLLDEPTDLLLGVDPGTARHDHAVVLPAGSAVVLYTDGLVERRGPSLQVGLDWLVDALTELGALPPDQLCDALVEQVRDHHEDDVALLVLRVPPEGG